MRQGDRQGDYKGERARAGIARCASAATRSASEHAEDRVVADERVYAQARAHDRVQRRRRSTSGTRRASTASASAATAAASASRTSDAEMTPEEQTQAVRR